MTTMNKPKQWEIWTAQFAYEDAPNIKKFRPILVIENKEFYPILGAKITSHKIRNNYPGEYSIKKWKEAGLTKESTIRLSKRLLLEEIDFKEKIGRLSPIDILGVQEKFKEL